MSQTRIKQALFGTALALAAAFGAVGSAQATTYKGAWHPAYGGMFPNLGWEGEGLFNIPDACLSSTGWVSNGNACSNGGMKMLSGTLTFFDIASPSVPVETFALNTSVVIYEMFVKNGALTGVSSGFFAPIVPDVSDSIAGSGVYAFHQKFLKEVSPQNTPSVQLYNTLGNVDPICLFEVPACEGGVSKDKATLVLTPAVPEPETYAMMLAGLAAIGFMVRRRRA